MVLSVLGVADLRAVRSKGPLQLCLENPMKMLHLSQVRLPQINRIVYFQLQGLFIFFKEELKREYATMIIIYYI